jgi:hypothetical protein
MTLLKLGLAQWFEREASVRSEFYKKCYIAVTAEKHAVGWTPLVQVLWKQAGRQRQEIWIGYKSFRNRVDAEEQGLNAGKNWVSEQLLKLLIKPS